MQDLKIAAIQMTSVVGDIEGNLASIDRLLGDAAGQGADIACFPELCVSGYNTRERSGEPANGTRIPPAIEVPSATTDALRAIGKRHGIWFLVGLLERDSSGIVYNTQLVISANGIEGKYRKTHVPTTEIGTWRQGVDLPIFTHPKIKFGIEICYDTHFPEVSAALAEKGAELIFMPHASGGVEPPAEKQTRWERYVPARAYDNTVFTAICNQVGDNEAGHTFSGVTFVCDPTGKLMAQSNDGDKEEIVIAQLEANALEEARHVPETFFRHFRRPEIYDAWRSN
ncbi:MAG: nitrilase-related carbon-nitrogen hydrolase [Dehalococcoidia bacterium]